jgi:hypothetical protein
VHVILRGAFCKRIWCDARLGTLVIRYGQGPPDRVPLWLGYNFRNDRSDPNCVHELTSPWAREVVRTPTTGSETESTADMLTVPVDPRRRVIGFEVRSLARERTGDAWPILNLSGLTFETGRC